MGAFAAVAQGADSDPRLIVLRHDPEDAVDGIVLGLVGKAITFDTGGISIKPSARMDEMKSDMAGGGAVVSTMGAIAELGLPLRVLAVVPACENMLERAIVPAGRHRHRAQRQDDRGHEHRRRGSARARRRAHVRSPRRERHT